MYTKPAFKNTGTLKFKMLRFSPKADLAMQQIHHSLILADRKQKVKPSPRKSTEKMPILSKIRNRMGTRVSVLHFLRKRSSP